MTENDFILEDRLAVIRDTINKYGEDKFYLSFSGGKDSTVVHHLIDMALPGNRIPRVFSNTGIEYIAIVEFERERETGRSLCLNKSRTEYQTDARKSGLSIQEQGTFSKSLRMASRTEG